MTPGDAQSLGERFQRGDDGALHELYQRYAGPMLVTAISVLGDREQAADAVQRAFVQAWQAADGFDPNRELKPWLYAILQLAYFQGHSQSEIATELDLPLGTVKSRTSRARRHLADLLPHLRETAPAERTPRLQLRRGQYQHPRPTASSMTSAG